MIPVVMLLARNLPAGRQALTTTKKQQLYELEILFNKIKIISQKEIHFINPTIFGI